VESFFIGIEIGGTKLQLVLGNRERKIIDRRRFIVVRERGGEGIREQIEAGITDLASGRSIAGVGVGFGGPVDWRTGKICCSHQIEGWSDFELGKWVSDFAQAHARVDNDANVAALGEAIHGAGKGLNPVFYVTLGSGVGGGLVINGAIYHGAIPGESEIGHIRLDKEGRIVEQSCSGWAVDQKIREAVDQNSKLKQLSRGKEGGEAIHLKEALTAQDALAWSILNDTADDLGFGLSHVVHLMHPEVIILGGGLSLVGEALRASVQQAMDKYLMHAFAPGPEVRLAKLGEDAVPVGALLLA
jgi:glucokinase